jgi:acyl-CoA thioester hydrolase
VVYPDRLHVGARTAEVAEDRFTMEYRLVSERLGEVAAEGGGVVVAYDYRTARKAPLPSAVREAISRVETPGAGRDAG